MKTINVEGLPEPVVRAVEVVVETVRKQLHTPEKPQTPVESPAWPGKVIGKISRTKIYN